MNSLDVKVERYTPDIEVLSLFLKDINKYKVLDVEEEFNLFEDLKKGNEKARDKIIEANQRFVVSVAKKFSTKSNILDIINEGNIGLIEAISRFDNNKGIKFISFAVHYIYRSIFDYLKNENLIKQTNKAKTYFILNKIKNDFFKRNCRYPCSDEIIEIMKYDYNIEVTDKRDVYDLRLSSIDDNKEEDKNYNQMEFDDYYFHENDFLLDIYIEENRNKINELFNILTIEESTILKLYFGIDCYKEYSLFEIADLVKYSSERIRQIKDEALMKMKIYNQTKKVV